MSKSSSSTTVMTYLPIELEFAGGAELLVKEKRTKQSVSLPERTNWTLAELLQWVKDNLIAERPELFLSNDTVRPGILVLINDTDWELLGELEYVLQPNDRVTFISTLHGVYPGNMQPGARTAAEAFVTFLNKAVTPFHAVEECCQMLKTAGFSELKEADSWQLKPMGKYFVTRNKSTIYAFAIGGQYVAGNGVSMIAAHTDSPNLRVKPISRLSGSECLQVGVMPYGGGIWRTWFDRDLTLAGRAIVKDNSGKLIHKLTHIKRPIMCIPNLAIHLDRDANEKFVFNKEDQLKPILATCVADKLNEKECGGTVGDHHTAMVQILAKDMDVDPDKILDFELCVIDAQPACLGGIYEEFIFGPRLDNLVGTFTAVTGLINSLTKESNLKSDTNIRLVACFDNEECGSESAQGACTALTEWILRRLNASGENAQDSTTVFEESIAKSYLISADQAHAVHPNYAGKYDCNHSPHFHKGIVIKINANQRYATTAITYSILKEIAARAEVPLQKYIVRNDSLCGSTVGPIMSAKLGLQTIDVGTPQLAMHSIREMACTSGISHAQTLYTNFFNLLPEIMASLSL